jgi:hypothetical protein
MEQNKQILFIKSHTVRICGGDNSLLGTGTLFIREVGEKPLVLTAAHLFPDLSSSGKTFISLHLSFDEKDFSQDLDLYSSAIPETKYLIYIHPEFNSQSNKEVWLCI